VPIDFVSWIGRHSKATIPAEFRWLIEDMLPKVEFHNMPEDPYNIRSFLLFIFYISLFIRGMESNTTASISDESNQIINH
jgi:hypothetical protein